MVKKYGKKLEARDFSSTNWKADCQQPEKSSTQINTQPTKKVLSKTIHLFMRGMELPSAPLTTKCVLDWGSIS